MFNKEYIGYNFVYWSLFIESVFYLVIPFVSLKKTTYLFISAILFVCGGVVLHYYQASHTSLVRFAVDEMELFREQSQCDSPEHVTS